MLLRPLTDGLLTAAMGGTAQLYCQSRRLGGVLIGCDGTNVATVTIRRCSAPGDTIGSRIFHVTTKEAFWAPGSIEASEYIYAVVSGTGAGVQVYEAVE